MLNLSTQANAVVTVYFILKEWNTVKSDFTETASLILLNLAGHFTLLIWATCKGLTIDSINFACYYLCRKLTCCIFSEKNC